jgi:amino-acid N-acetyltransferase
MEIDGNVVGSVALYRYDEEQMAEIACLYVKQAHEGLGYGVELVRHAQHQAKVAGIPTVFALTNRAAEFFQQLGFQEMSADKIPASRHQQLVSSGRGSKVFFKSF